MGGGYTNVIPIPVDNPTTKAISGALFKPEGAGPFPAVIFMPGCGGVDSPPARASQKTLTDHLQSKGVATLIVDPFTPRGQLRGCSGGNSGTKDALAAVKVLRAMPDIEVKHIFLQGLSWGATSSLGLVDTTNPDSSDAKVAGVIAYYPSCSVVADPSVPVLVLIGEKDDWTPASTCTALKDTPNFEVVVYPGATHAFNMPGVGDWEGHHMVYDEKATQDAERRADAFMAAHMPPK
jgi:dienelactone hydrolase